jgi:hypothetical protein
VAKSRPLVEVESAITKGLLFGEPQWVGLIIRPLNYSLQSALLHISSGPGSQFESCQTALLEISSTFQPDTNEVLVTSDGGLKQNCATSEVEDNCTPGRASPDLVGQGRQEHLHFKDGNVELPEWASMVATVLWIQVKADPDFDVSKNSSGVPELVSPSSSPSKILPVAPQTSTSSAVTGETGASVAVEEPVTENLENGIVGQEYLLSNGSLLSKVGGRALNVKIMFGASRSRVYERCSLTAYD